MNIRHNGGILPWAALTFGLVLFYYQIFVIEPVNSDTANAMLVAQDLASGNWRLHGWFMAPDNFLGLDEVFYALIWRITHDTFLTLRLVPVLQWSGLALLAIFLATRSRFLFQSLFILSATFLVPVFGPYTEHLYFQAPFHVLTTICMILAVMLCGRLCEAGRLDWLWTGIFAFIVIDAAFSDPFFQFILTGPLLLALWICKPPSFRQIALLYLVCVVCGMLLERLNILTGGFTQPATNIPALASLSAIPGEIYRTALLWPVVLGCFPSGQPLWLMILAGLRIPLILLLFVPVFQCALSFRKLEFTDLCLLLIVIANMCAVVFTNASADISTARFFLPAWVCASILAAKFMRKHTAIAGYSLIISALALAVCVMKIGQFSEKSVRFLSQDGGYIAALETRGLTRGYAGYWQASDTTVATGGKIKVAAVILDQQGHLSAYDWFAKQSWYKGDAASTRFFVSTSNDRGGPNPKAIIAMFGKPDDVFVVEGVKNQVTDPKTGEIITYVYNRAQPSIR
ncbi:MAG: hypothetical protein KGQ79_06085 [Proteobacteria bacterium]|nr:hypothetical protein [Pseudomonadota bacterium]MBU6424936.1 hypothetical protein [Rhodospirillales bacterium]